MAVGVDSAKLRVRRTGDLWDIARLARSQHSSGYIALLRHETSPLIDKMWNLTFSRPHQTYQKVINLIEKSKSPVRKIA